MVRKPNNLIISLAGVVLVALAVSAFVLPYHQSQQVQNGQNLVMSEQIANDAVVKLPLHTNPGLSQLADSNSSLNLTTDPSKATEQYLELTIIDNTDDIQTNFHDVIEVVAELVEKWENLNFGQPGWFHFSYEEYTPLMFRSDSMLATDISSRELYPDEIVIGNRWYNIDREGYFEEHIFHLERENGDILQRVASIGGKWINLTLWPLGPEFQRPPSLPSRLKVTPHWSVQYMLEDARNSASDIQARHTGLEYTIVVTTYYEDEVRLFDYLDPAGERLELIKGNQFIFVFDWETGSLISREVLLLTKDGKSIVKERITNLIANITSEEPPAEYTQTLINGGMLLEETK